MESKQVNKNLTKLIRIDAGYHQLLKMRACETRKSIKHLIEEVLGDYLQLPYKESK